MGRGQTSLLQPRNDKAAQLFARQAICPVGTKCGLPAVVSLARLAKRDAGKAPTEWRKSSESPRAPTGANLKVPTS